jgi:NTP pyrophosphatase (non-canonical NTP hydrolase)
MNFSDYQSTAFTTAGRFDCKEMALAVWALGLVGESGEVSELIKKHVGHGHALNTAEVAKELGDVLWYIAALANELGISLEDIATANIEKLRRRYPEGFSHEASKSRAAYTPLTTTSTTSPSTTATRSTNRP